MTILIQEMKDILSEAMQNNTNINLSDCINTDFDCNNLHDTIIGNYPLIGFECAAFVELYDALEGFNDILIDEMKWRYEALDSLIDRGLDSSDIREYFEDQFVYYWIEITTEYKQNTIKAFVSAGDGKHELLSEIVDTSSKEAFAKQCEKFVSVL